MTKDEAVLRAQAWLRTPYHPGAYVMGVGVDCAMILVGVFAGHSDVPADFDPRPYPSDWHLHQTEEKYLGWLRLYADEIEKPEPAAVAVWRFGKAFSHAAIVINDCGDVIHAYKNAGCATLGNLSETMLANRDRLLFRVRGVT